MRDFLARCDRRISIGGVHFSLVLLSQDRQWCEGSNLYLLQGGCICGPTIHGVFMQVTVIGITEGNPTPKFSGFPRDDSSTALPKAQQLTTASGLSQGRY